MNTPQYTGTLRHCKMNGLQKKAYECWYNQRQRCNNPKNKRYSTYGAKGISVEYSSRDFMSWWLFHRETFSGKIATVGRIDHSKNYSFDNIEMVDMSENSKERNIRLGPSMERSRRVQVLTKEGIVFAEFISARECARIYRNSKIGAFCIGSRSQPKHGPWFRYKEMGL